MTDRLTCEETFRRLDLFLDRALGAEELRQVEAHLEECAVCAGEYRFETRLVDEVRSKLTRIRTSRSLLDDISARLAEAASEGRSDPGGTE